MHFSAKTKEVAHRWPPDRTTIRTRASFGVDVDAKYTISLGLGEHIQIQV